MAATAFWISRSGPAFPSNPSARPPRCSIRTVCSRRRRTERTTWTNLTARLEHAHGDACGTSNSWIGSDHDARERRASSRHDLPVLWADGRSSVRRSGNVPAVRELPHRRAVESDGAVLSAPGEPLPALLSRSTGRIRQPGAHLHRVRVFFVILDELVRTRRDIRAGHDGA